MEDQSSKRFQKLHKRLVGRCECVGLKWIVHKVLTVLTCVDVNYEASMDANAFRNSKRPYYERDDFESNAR